MVSIRQLPDFVVLLLSILSKIDASNSTVSCGLLVCLIDLLLASPIVSRSAEQNKINTGKVPVVVVPRWFQKPPVLGRRLGGGAIVYYWRGRSTAGSGLITKPQLRPRLSRTKQSPQGGVGCGAAPGESGHIQFGISTHTLTPIPSCVTAGCSGKAGMAH